jgi:hypothetical protein
VKFIKYPLWPIPSLAAAIVLLSILLNFDYPADPLFIWQQLLPSLDVCFLLLPLALAACCGKRWLFWSTLPIWALFLALRLIRIGDTVVPMYLDRPFNLYIDSSYLYGLYDLLKTSSQPGDFFLVAMGATIGAIGVCAVSWLAWQVAAKALSNGRVRLLFLGISSLFLGVALILDWQPAKPLALVRLGQEILSIRHQIQQQQNFVTRLKQTAQERSAGPPATLNGLGGADVQLVIIESYGHVVFNQPRYRQAMESIMNNFGRTLAQHGFEVVSSYLQSSTYGGESWLAHGTLESGVRVGNDLEETALLRSSLEPMASIFGKNGYRTVSVMPGTRFAFPQGSYFGYQQNYYAWHFDYKGPSFSWAPMPDQYVLDWVRRRECMTPGKPLFVRYALISSHASFNIQPPYIADWETIGDGSIYNALEPVLFPTEWSNLKNAGEAYLRSLEYEFDILGDYLAHFVTADALFIILGDHQPNLQLTGPGEPWSVPVHIISRNPRLLEPFRKRGYTDGLFPAQPLPHAGMETFLPNLLEDFR